MAKKRKITFRELAREAAAQPTPLQQWVAEVARLTRRSISTVNMWVWGRQAPDELTRSVIADHFGVDPDTLFPTPTTAPTRKEVAR